MIDCRIQLLHDVAQAARLSAQTSRLCYAVAMLLCVHTMVPAQEVDFDKAVAPIFISHCLECHGAGELKGGLNLSQVESAMKGGENGQVFVPGDAEGSLIWQRVMANEMPPKHPLKDKHKAVLKQWLAGGAKWGTSPIDPFSTTTDTRAGRDWWALQPLREVLLPKVHSDPPGNEIDAFLLRNQLNARLVPSAPASPRAQIRRLYFDLTGLPPTPEQAAAFVADPSDVAYRKVVEELLASDHYGERWARHWLDVVRYGESDGFERNAPRRNAWPYRDWVIHAFNNDMPYDEFVRMQLFGDQLKGGPDGAAATGFWVAGVHNTVVGGSDRMKKLARQDEIEEVLATVGQTFLGLTVNCARCHDHKFDPITQREFYQMASTISGLGYGERVEQSPGDQAILTSMTTALKQLNERLSTINQQAREAIIAARKTGDAEVPEPPAAFARWEFNDDLKDSVGELHGKAVGNAKLENGALMVDGNSFVETSALTKNVTEKTLEAWVQLENLDQRGGGAITIETKNGVVFDSIVFGEREPGRWMAGSNGFARTESFNAEAETHAAERPVHVAQVYQADGTIIGYRDGVAYGQSIRKADLQPYKAGETEFIFGLRHKPLGGGRTLTARIHRAAFYDRALTPAEVAASSGDSANYVPEKQIVEWLPQEQKSERNRLVAEIAEKSTARDAQAAKANQTIYTLTAGQGATTNVLLRGDPDNVGDVVTPGAVASVSGVQADFALPADAPEPDRRRKLMEWITHSDNPLFSRVMANRIWHYHFGTGIVDSPNDFGFNGGRPSHPELLEWLAGMFQADGYRIKDLHRLIVTSRTYRQAGYLPVDWEKSSSENDPREVDAGNRLLWRMTPRRLEAEAIRDAMLSVAGKLNSEMGGPAFEDVSIVSNNGTTYYEPIDVDGPQFFRRTVYRLNPRGQRSALLDTFDCPDPASAAPRRNVTTTPLQALSLLNNSFVLRMATYFAERVEREAGADVSAQVVRAWQLALCRDPSTDELRLSTELVQQHGLAALCRGLFNSSEFVVVE
jgi:hypothetical protein